MMDEKISIKVKRSVAMDAKIQAIKKGMTREDYLEELVNKKNDSRISKTK